MSRLVRAVCLSLVLMAGTSAAQAVTVTPATLVAPLSFEYFGLLTQNNVRTSSTVGTLDISATAGCGAVCIATSALGASPSVDLAISEAPDDFVSGGYGRVTLKYLVRYDNPVAGSYAVHIHTEDMLNIASTASGQTYFGFGYSVEYNSFGNGGLLIDQTHCIVVCNNEFGNPATQGPLGDYDVQMLTGYSYVVTLIANINVFDDGVVSYARVDPTFSTSAVGGSFAFSPGVFAQAVPEPGTWAMVAAGFGLLGGTARRRQRRDLAAD